MLLLSIRSTIRNEVGERKIRTLIGKNLRANINPNTQITTKIREDKNPRTITLLITEDRDRVKTKRRKN